MLTIGSAFSGLGGLEKGLEDAGLGPTIWQIEKEPMLRQVLAKHWPNARRYGDIEEIKEGELEPVDIICGGSPCQDLSTAGKRAGLAGSRSGLWYRMLDIISWVRPGWVVVENVAQAGNSWIDAVRSGLAGEGYESLPFTVEASMFGAPHRRARGFVVAYANRHAVQLQPGRSCRAHREAALQPAEHGAHEGWPSELEVADGLHGPAPWMVRALGNACVPQCAQVAGELIQELRRRRDEQET